MITLNLNKEGLLLLEAALRAYDTEPLEDGIWAEVMLEIQVAKTFLIAQASKELKTNKELQLNKQLKPNVQLL
jgi:hypothetical protein